MSQNPYTHLPKSAFWKTGVAQENPYLIENLYKKKFNIQANTKIATAGSCFAQHISRHLKINGYKILDVEPPPPGLPENLRKKFGYSTYSARYGNIYTVRQLLQLAQEAAGDWTPENYVWKKDGKFFDALRPSIDPEGVIEHFGGSNSEPQSPPRNVPALIPFHAPSPETGPNVVSSPNPFGSVISAVIERPTLLCRATAHEQFGCEAGPN